MGMTPAISTSYRYGDRPVDEATVLAAAIGAMVVSVATPAMDDALVVITTDRGTLTFWHAQDCCESVYLESGGDELPSLVGGTITVCEARDDGGAAPIYPDDAKYGSFTWTFYELRTTRGDVTLRFYGSSNGYYSEAVDVRWEPA